jgi:hypothetical protein
MPHSWIRISRGTSPKLRECMSSDTSRAKFQDCVTRIVVENGGRVETFLFEESGRWARARVFWDRPEQKQQIIDDLEAEELLDPPY